MESTTSTGGAIGATGNGRYAPPPPGTRSAEQIRSDIEAQRGELSRSVDALRHRWVEVTDVGAPAEASTGASCSSAPRSPAS